MIIINNWGTKLHTCGGLQSYNKMKGKSSKNYYNSNNSGKEKVKEHKEQKRTELNQEDIELIMKEMHKETKNIINNIVKNLSK